MAVHNNVAKPISGPFNPGTTTANPQGPNPPVVAAPVGVQHIGITGSAPWVPQRGVAPIAPILISNRLQHITKVITPKKTSASPVISATIVGIPQAVFNVSAAQSPLKVQNKTVSQITVTFSRNFSDKTYDHTNVWVKGYQGNSNYVEYAGAVNSPANFTLESNGDVVTIALQAVSANNQISAPIADCPQATVTLSGVVTNPPAPTITQTLVAIPLGYQFTFEQVQLSAGTEDVMKSYKVYRNTANTFSGATVIQTIPDDGKNDGAPVVVQDQQTGGSVFYYFITSTNTAGLESSASSAQSAQVDSGLVNSRSTVQVTNTSIHTTTSNVLTQSGTSTTIDVAAFTIQYGFGQVSYNSGSVNPGAYGMYYVYFSDPNFTGGAVTFLATTAGYQTGASDSYVCIGTLTTTAGGGGSGGGGGGGACFTPDTQIITKRGPVRFDELILSDEVETQQGFRPIETLYVHNFDGELCAMDSGEGVTGDHLIAAKGTWLAAAVLFAPRFRYSGPVYNLHVKTREDSERNYRLANGLFAHNNKML